MSGPSKVIVLDPDPRAGRQVQLGFAREGVEAVLAAVPDDPSKLELTNRESSLVLIGGTDGLAVELVRRMRKLLTDNDVDIPIVFTGTGKRGELEQAGADEVVLRPAYLRDVVTIGRLMSGVPATQRAHLVGSLVETTGVYTLVRAFAALGRSAVLTLVRGLRRGEVRFYKGEVTSAQVGLIHGQAALHQLLLWTDARFDFHHEDNIVRRQQIPLSPDDLFADAERFLEGVRESAGRLSPAMVLEQDVARIHNLGTQVPTEVHGVLRMFDGHRVLADVLEDSPYRVFETLRVAQKALEAGLLKPIDGHKTKATWRTLLTIEEWLVGSETRDAIVERTAQLDSAPVAGSTKKKKKRNKRRVHTPPAGTPAIAKPEIDWGALVPRIVGAEVGPLSGVVPAQRASGEIIVTTRDAKREGLEALMDTDKRQKIFPTEIGIEPSVVWNEEADRERAEQEQSERHAKLLAAAEAEEATRQAQAKQEEQAAAAEQARVTAERSAKELAETKAREDAARAAAKIEVERAIKARQEAEEQRAREGSQARVKEQVERMRIDREIKELADKQAALEAERDAKINAAKREAEASMAHVKAALERRTREEAETRQRAIGEAEAREVAARAAPVAAMDSENARTTEFARVDVPTESERARATDEEVVTERIPKMELEANSSDASMLVKHLVAEGIAHDSLRTSMAEPVTETETPTATVTVADNATVVARADIAVVTTTPTVTVGEAVRPAEVTTTLVEARPVEVRSRSVGEAPRPSDVTPTSPGEAPRPSDAPAEVRAASAEVRSALAEVMPGSADARAAAAEVRAALAGISPAHVASSAARAEVSLARPADLRSAEVISATASGVSSGAPLATEDDPSDGVVRAMIATADTARLAARSRRPSTNPPASDGPPEKEKTGEIRERPTRTTLEPATSEPSILVTDIADAHSAVSAAFAAQATAPASSDAASVARELSIAETRKDALAASEAEEAFFRKADASHPHVRHAPAESFDDLDEGYEPPKFWDRVFGRRKRPSTHPPFTAPPIKGPPKK